MKTTQRVEWKEERKRRAIDAEIDRNTWRLNWGPTVEVMSADDDAYDGGVAGSNGGTRMMELSKPSGSAMIRQKGQDARGRD